MVAKQINLSKRIQYVQELPIDSGHSMKVQNSSDQNKITLIGNKDLRADPARLTATKHTHVIIEY